MTKSDVSKELLRLISLISFFKQLRHKTDIAQLGFFFVNELYNIAPYRQCILWEQEAGAFKIRSASGQTDVGENSPLAQFITRTIKSALKNADFSDRERVKDYVEKNSYAQILETKDLGAITVSDSERKDFFSRNIVHVFLYDNEAVIAGLWIDKDSAAGDMEKALLEDIGDALSAQIQAIRKHGRTPFKSWRTFGRVRMALLIALAVFCLWPVRFSVIAPAEVVAQNMQIISVPFNGLIGDVAIKPNQQVRKGDIVFSVDKTQLKNEYALAVQELENARQKLLKTERETFSDPSKRSDVNILREEIKLKTLDADYAEERLAMADIRAPKDGIVLFSDANDILGQPVRAGDRIMTLADPQQLELLVKIPADSMIDVSQDKAVRFFLNIDPLNAHRATLYNISYQPTKESDGILSYKARAKIEDAGKIEKVGLTGTAKIYGKPTVMIVNILRRPFIAFRKLTGL